MQDNLENELFNLSQGVSLCNMHCNDNYEWVQSACTLMRNYGSCALAKKSQLYYFTAEKCNCTQGDFQNVDMLHKGVSAAIAQVEAYLSDFILAPADRECYEE